MGPGEKKEEDPKEPRCSCGALLEKAEFDPGSGELICPNCGAVTSHQETDISGDETEMLNVGDMARMAQEGVDPSISGEWDTAERRVRRVTRRRKK